MNSSEEPKNSLARRFKNVVRKSSLSVIGPVVGSQISPSDKSNDTNITWSMQLQDYEMENVIGYGSSAVVYSAIYKPSSTRVAIKVINLDLFERNQIEELRRELQIMTLSRHKNLLPVNCAFVEGHSLYIVTRYLAGGSCLSIMKAAYPHGLDEGSIAFILKECLKGLDYLHKNNHIHRDVKAGNILMDKDGSVLLADFGVSASLGENGERNGQRKTFVGTPCWLSPEVLVPEKGYNEKADIWSFGITALEFACGHAPYARFPPLKVLMLILKTPSPSLTNFQTKHKYSKQFSSMIDLCLQKDPTKRPSAEKLLEHPFFKNIGSRDLSYLLKDLPQVKDRNITKPEEGPLKQVETVSWDFNEASIPAISENSKEIQSVSTPMKAEEENLSTDKEEKKKNPREIRRGRFSVNLRPEEVAEIIETPPSTPPNGGASLSRRGRFEIQSSPEGKPIKSEQDTKALPKDETNDIIVTPEIKREPSKSQISAPVTSQDIIKRSRAASDNLKKIIGTNAAVNMDRKFVEELVQRFEDLETLAVKLMEESHRPGSDDVKR